MNAAYLSALSALLGSSIGAGATFATTWLTQHHQDVVQRISQERSRREQLYGQFIDEASRLFADALATSLESPGRLVLLYSILAKMRLFASDPVIESAQGVMQHIVDTYRKPNLDFRQPEASAERPMDILEEFTGKCREDLART